MAERVRFAPERPTDDGRGVWIMALAFGLLSAVFAVRGVLMQPPVQGVPIEVVGDVTRPGMHLLSDPTLAAALEVAGAEVDVVPHRVLMAGEVVVVRGGGVRVSPSADPWLVGLPVDVNVHGADALAAIPGVGEALAAAIVADRAEHGPYDSLQALTRVPGVGPALVEKLEPFITLGDRAVEPAGPVDLNTATRRQLERLPGIGPALADAIVADRVDRGPFATVDALQRVRGIGPSHVARLAEQVIASESR